SYWQAKQAALALPVQWQAGAGATLHSAAVVADLAARLDSEDGYVYHQRGDMDIVAGKAGGAVKSISAEYRAPFLAHAA
ncbi:MAG: hypothetical protein J0626_12350, partial [Rhodospirillaceae bacterium]|nr:hypothetical protein [Rhodospirillaceae bacterium]